MSALDERYQPNETAELEIWREATTIHGGCGPVGLALALKRRGFAALVVVSHDGLFLKSRASQGGEMEVMQILPGARSRRSIPARHPRPSWHLQP